MRRLFVILMLCLLSLQSAWAVADICGDAGSVQGASQQLSGGGDQQSSDCICCAQCTSCHILAAAPGLSLDVPVRHAPVAHRWRAGSAPPSSTDPARPERPKWPAC
jgi:hypothetical protein